MKEDRSIATLRERVYGFLKGQINDQKLKPGSFLDLNLIGRELGMSRTPLRDALFQLESEGFITIYPRKGVMLNILDLRTIRNIYEIIGALESVVLVNAAVDFTQGDLDLMKDLNCRMGVRLKKEDYDTYYLLNVEFHNVFLAKSDNEDLLKTARTLRERLYDFPRSRGLLKEWEASNLNEHIEMVRLLEKGNFTAAAEYLRDVHWSFSVQERYIRKYYFALNNNNGK